MLVLTQALDLTLTATIFLVLEAHLESVRWRENAQLAGFGVCVACIQAYAALFHVRVFATDWNMCGVGNSCTQLGTRSMWARLVFGGDTNECLPFCPGRS